MDPWLLDLIVVRNGSYSGTERRTLSRDVERGLLIRVRRGVYVERNAWVALTPEQQHVVEIRALAAVCSTPPVLSYWSAAVLHGLPSDRRFLARVHTVTGDRAHRGLDGVAAHLLPLEDSGVVEVRGIRVTDPARTVVDIAIAQPFAEGVVVADGALTAGLPRDLLERSLDLAAGRKGAVRARDSIAFGHPGGESAIESRSRCTMFRLGLEPQDLQIEIHDHLGLAGVVDTWSRRYRVAGEADGAQKYLDPAFATAGAGRAVYDEKRREDRVRSQVAGLARWGSEEAGNTARLGPILAAAGLRPAAHRPRLSDWAAAAREARPRHRRGRLTEPRV